MQFNNALIVQLAWPMVTLVALLILGPGGLLVKVFKEIAQSFGRFSQGYNDLKDIIAKTNDMATDMENSLGKLRGQSAQMEDLKADMQAFKESIERLRLVMDQTNSDVDRLASRSDSSEPSKVYEEEYGAFDLSEEEAERLYAEVMSQWESFDRAFRSYVDSIGEAYDGRAVGSIALSLADGRRRNPLDRVTAELIDNNFFEIKSMRRTKNEKRDWGREYFDVMKRDIHQTTKAIRELQEASRLVQ